MTSSALRLAYTAGARDAHQKLGTCAGPITYPSTSNKETSNSVIEKQKQRTYKEMDEHDDALKLTKSADYIRGDLDKIKPHKALIQKSNIERAFSTNENLDEEYGLGDPPTTQPHGSDKVAAAPPMGLGGLTPKSPNVFSSNMKNPIKPLMPIKNPITNLHKQTNNIINTSTIGSRAPRVDGDAIPTFTPIAKPPSTPAATSPMNYAG